MTPDSTSMLGKAVSLLSPTQQNVIIDIVTIMLAERQSCPTMTPIQALYLAKDLSATTFGRLDQTTNEQWAHATDIYISTRLADAEKYKNQTTT